MISETITKQPNQQVLDWLDAQLSETLYLSVITIAKGISKLPVSKRKESLTKWLNETLPHRFKNKILGLDIATMILWGNLVAELEQNGRPLPAMDSLIAATEVQNSLTLVTRNEKDFAGTKVLIINP